MNRVGSAEVERTKPEYSKQSALIRKAMDCIGPP